MKWYTCTPVHFQGDMSFSSRDSGLLSYGFARSGVESRPIMPGPPLENDDPRLIRTDYENLGSVDWWKSHQLGGVVFYGWGDGRYTHIAKAIKDSGAILVTNMDTCGLITVQVETMSYIKHRFSQNVARHGYLKGIPKATAQLAYNGLITAADKNRLDHLDHANAISVVSPYAAHLVRQFALVYQRPDIAHKIVYVPHPQMEIFRYDGTPKEKIILSVARWKREDWPQKNPRLLFAALSLFLRSRPDYRAVIVGSGASELTPMAQDAGIPFRQLEFIESIPVVELPAIYARASIGFWASRSEGQQGTGAQALCCGCSVVSTGGLPMSSFYHYISRQSGRIAISNTPRHLADALMLEAMDWDAGHRDPWQISDNWMPEFHSSSVANRIRQIAQTSSNLSSPEKELL